MKKNLNIMEMNGITLMTLVVTIIILLILAGITINLILGEHGIISLVKQAKNEYQNAEKRENQALEKYKNEMDEFLNPDVPVDFSPIEGEGDGTGRKMSIQAKTTAKYGIKEYQYYLNDKYITSTQEESFVFDNLTPFMEYRTYIIAIDHEGNKKKSSELKFYTGQYLFKDGNEYDDLTGGWKGIYRCDSKVLNPGEQYYGIGFFNKNNNKLNFGNNVASHGDAGFQTNHNITLKNYKKICMKGTYSSSYYVLSKYPEAFVALQMTINNSNVLVMKEQQSKDNAILNYEYVFDEKVKEGENGKLLINSFTDWQPDYRWYASISEIFMLK